MNTIQLKDCRLARNSGIYYEAEWYYGSIPKPIEFTGKIEISGNVEIDEDRRIVRVMNVRGQVAIAYRDYSGFKQIEIID